jgi:hypothetical protein
MAVDPMAAGRWVVRVFDAVGHGGGHMAELFRRGQEWLAVTRRVLHRSEAHHELCRTACITCILSSVSQDDARDGMLDRRAALRVLEGAGAPRRSIADRDTFGSALYSRIRTVQLAQSGRCRAARGERCRAGELPILQVNFGLRQARDFPRLTAAPVPMDICVAQCHEA